MSDNVLTVSKQKKILFLTLVHPDFLPPVYAAAQTLRDLNYDIHILTFDSLVPAKFDVGSNISIETLGNHHNVSLLTRLKLRRIFKKRAATLISENPMAVIAFCPFSYLVALNFKGKLPLLYYAMEISDFIAYSIKRSPFSQFKNLRALRAVKKADFVATPSVQRSSWLAGRSHLNFMPHTIMNTAYITANQFGAVSTEIYEKIVPREFLNKKVILYTGAVNYRLCVFDLVKAFVLLNDDRYVLIVTGNKQNKYCDEIREFVNNSAIKKNILLLPYVTREEMIALQENAHLGACLNREIDKAMVSKMIAPNKLGEYLSKRLFIIGIKCEYLRSFESHKVATLAASPSPEDICAAIVRAFEIMEKTDYKAHIANFVKEYFCMQQQLQPMIKFLENCS